MHVFTYVPERHAAVGVALASDRLLLLVSGDAEPGVLARLHTLMAEPLPDAADVLEVLSDPTTCRRFALLEVQDLLDRRVTVSMRGDVRLDLTEAESSSVEWPDHATWLTGEVFGVTALSAAMEATPTDGVSLPLYRGVARAGAVGVTLLETPSLTAPRALTPLPDPHVSSDYGVSMALPTWTAHLSEPTHGDDAELELTAVTIDALPTARVQLPGAWEEVSTDGSAHDDAGAWTLELPDGNKMAATSSIVVGRKPWRTDPDETTTCYILAPSPHKEISGKHLEFAVVGDKLVARDLDSTNGTLVTTLAGPPRLLHEGAAVSLTAGDVLDLGEGFRIVVADKS